ncbi:MAG: methyltransferase domain-containing protein [Chloroflexota bacterium]|nr:methyltransferase domain-containing protein [Chloroflexota bacterium]
MSARRANAAPEFEAEIIPGLEAYTCDELRSKFGGKASQIRKARAGFLRFRYSGGLFGLQELRSVVAIYQIHHFAIPRPKALLGHQHFARLKAILSEASRSFLNPPRTLGIGAAGSESSVMRRLRLALAGALRLDGSADEKGELFVRFMPDRRASGWEVLVRITPRPLSVRDYRLENMPGSLNATVAFVMTQDGALPHRSTIVNLCSGASTIAIEHALAHPADLLLAVDCSDSALETGRRNAQASGAARRIHHLRADGTNAPLASRSADRLYADMPFGHLIGSHEENERLYPAILREAARLARPDAAFAVLSHEIRLMRRSLETSRWRAEQETRINMRGLYPRLFVLRRNSATI